MATILLQAAGAALGGVFGPVGAVLGRAAGGLAGSLVDQALINGGRTVSGARLATARIPGADEGAAISRVYGTARIGGTLIWATRFEEDVRRERSGGKATGPKVETFRYYANLAIGLCEGQIAGVRRVWADGRELDLTGIEMRVHRGEEAQLPDPLIEAKQGAGNAPAYRGIAYVVFERLPLDAFGNRIPLLQFEVLRPVGALERQIRAVTIIPGATEHGYATDQVTEKTGEGSARIMNRHVLTAGTDWQASLDELTALCPNLERLALVVAWFGTDLRAGHCRILPGVETAHRDDESTAWTVAGIARADAHLVSTHGGGPAYGGTPSDGSIAQAIADLKARGLEVYLYPFVMMDIPQENGLPDPYGGAEQASYPWRGRITCHPGPGRPGSADRTAAARAQVLAFSQGAEGYRRMVLHYAQLAVSAGGVDGFLLGSELRGLTQLRDGTGAFPFVEQLVQLGSDVRAILGPQTKLTYGADWSEYFGYQSQDGSGDHFFHLDPLWASAAIDAVGIDNYMPLSDWRDGDLSEANPDGFRVPDDLAALQAQITAGEGFDWYYASAADRSARIRTPITDGAAGKPWVFRFKDIAAWWGNRHYDRVGGVEVAQPTAWQPGMKPVWFTELGCAAVDKGANQPNVFVDLKSAESAAPHFSRRARSDTMQRRFLEAHHRHWSGQAPAGPVDPGRLFAWTWDARPYPAFPANLSAWSDGGHWRAGHWLNGRLGATTLADAIAAILTDHGFADFDVSEVTGDLTGYVQAEVTSARALLSPLLDVFRIDVVEDAGRLRFRSRGAASMPAHAVEVLADVEDAPLWTETRGHDSDFAAEVVIGSYNPALDYEQASARSRRTRTGSQRVLSYDLPAVLAEETALAAAEAAVRDQWISRRSLSLALSPAEIGLQPGDVIRLPDLAGTFIVSRLEEGDTRRIEARQNAAWRPSAPIGDSGQPGDGGSASDGFAPLLHLLDLPHFTSGAGESFARAAGLCRPWQRILLSSSSTTEGYALRAALDRPARIGRLAQPLPPGTVSGRFDRGSTLELDLFFGGVSSAAAPAVLAGENRLALRAGNGAWEILAFAEAEEIAPNRWRLGSLLRGLAGTEDAMASGAMVAAPVVLLDEAVVPLGLTAEERGRSLNWLAEGTTASVGRVGPIAFAGGLRAQTPLAPVHLRARRGDAGIAMSWVRRGRIEADDWDAAEIALDEAEEGYRIDILDGSSVRRTADVTVPRFLYDEALELADFGALQTSLAVRIRQKGRVVPLGLPAQAMFSL